MARQYNGTAVKAQRKGAAQAVGGRPVGEAPHVSITSPYDSSPDFEAQQALNARPKNVWETQGFPVTTTEYNGDYYSRGYYPVRTGEVRVLEAYDPELRRLQELEQAYRTRFRR